MSEHLRMELKMQELKQTEQSEAQRLLQQIINQEQEMSAKEAVIVGLGVLRGETPSEHWNSGGISLSNRLINHELIQPEVDNQHEKLGRFFVKARIGAPKRCGDGREIAGYDNQSVEWHDRGLGVQIFGGTAGDATGIRLSKGFEPNTTFAQDVKQTANKHQSAFAPGDHTDDHAEGEKTGCGAIDGQISKNKIYNNIDEFQTIQSVLNYLYNKAGLAISSGFYDRLKHNSFNISEHAEEYFADKHLALQTITELSSNGIEPLSGKHNETSLTLNFVEGTTFDRDRYSADSNGLIQNFNIDFWAIIKEHKENTAFVLVDQIATAMNLTDGTLEVFARLPQTDSDSLK